MKLLTNFEFFYSNYFLLNGFSFAIHDFLKRVNI